MSKTRDVAVLVGSLRKASWSRKVANALIEIAPAPLALRVIEIGQLQLYNQDFDDEKRPPAEWTHFRDNVRKADALLFVTPEYNRSVPGVLKNAVDVGSRPKAQSVWTRKPGAIVSVTTGKLGAFGANHHLRQSLVFVDVPTMQQPEVYLGGVESMFDDSGKLTDPGTRQFLAQFLGAFSEWIRVLAPPSAT
jgi:chromate reductase, NAD(P)H dehydrogenase (quinone)